MQDWIRENYNFDVRHGVWRRDGEIELPSTEADSIYERIVDFFSKGKDPSTASVTGGKERPDGTANRHSHAQRANLARPIRNLLKGSILEIGAEDGALTRFIGESGAQIVAVEANAQRAASAAARCADLPNVSVIADAFARLPSGPQFDVVTLFGVDEQARLFVGMVDGDPLAALLAHARGFVRPGGLLVLAIENPQGLKHRAGGVNAHSGLSAGGADLPRGDERATRPGRAALAGQLVDTGLHHQQWWYPAPDHRRPVSVLSDQVLEHDVDLSALLVEAVRLDPEIDGALAFALEQAWQPVYRSRLLGELANSFLVVSSDAALPAHPVLGVHYGPPRRPEFMKEVRFEWRDGAVHVRRSRLDPAPAETSSKVLSLHLADEPFLAARSWHHQLRALTARTGWTQREFTDWARRWLDAVLLRSGLPSKPLPGPATTVPGDLIDAIPLNMAFDEEGNPHFFDQEWRLNEPAEFGMIVYRGIFTSLDSLSGCARPDEGVSVSKISLFTSFTQSLEWKISIADIERYTQLEGRIQEAVSGGARKPFSVLRDPIPVYAGSGHRDASA